MASPQNVELEAAKFLHKLIQDSKDEPVKLATKLYVVCVVSSSMNFFNYSFTLIKLGLLAIDLMSVSDTTTYEIQRKGTFNAISSDIKVKHLKLKTQTCSYIGIQLFSPKALL
jgi:hypothetical protein